MKDHEDRDQLHAIFSNIRWFTCMQEIPDIDATLNANDLQAVTYYLCKFRDKTFRISIFYFLLLEFQFFIFLYDSFLLQILALIHMYCWTPIETLHCILQ